MRLPLAGVMGAAAGWALGWVLDRAIPDPTAQDEDPEPCPRCPSRHEPCREPVEEAVADLRVREERLYGTPIPFPDHAPPEHRPEQFGANVSRILAACDVDLELVDVDCAEYPCLAILEVGARGGNLGSCPAWKEQYPGAKNSGFGGSVLTPDGERRWTMFGPAPDDLVIDRNFLRRLDVRQDRARAEVMARWGAVERTPEEERQHQIDQVLGSIERWERLDPPPEGILRSLEEALERLDP